MQAMSTAKPDKQTVLQQQCMRFGSSQNLHYNNKMNADHTHPHTNDHEKGITKYINESTSTHIKVLKSSTKTTRNIKKKA